MTATLIIAAELATRRKHWIAGVPTPADIDATVTHLAHRLKLPREEVRTVVRAELAALRIAI